MLIQSLVPILCIVVQLRETGCDKTLQTKTLSPLQEQGNEWKTREESLIAVDKDVDCDVIIVGGSAAALGAALSSATASSNHVICLTEPTDWLGGQLTTSAVSAVDFGVYNSNWWFQSKRFQSMMESVGQGNPGNCWVSVKCFLPRILIYEWIKPKVAALPNLRVFYNTVPTSVSSKGRTVMSVKAIQRIPKQSPYRWNKTLSQNIADWYSPIDSHFFEKKIINFGGVNGNIPMVIEATQFGEVLVLANATYRVGVESPDEESSSTIESCGQCITYPFYMGASLGPAPKQEVPNPGGTFTLEKDSWQKIWTYRRSVAMPNSSTESFQLGETSNQNWGGGNDYCVHHLFLSHEDSAKQTSAWQGGVVVGTLALAELRAFGWFNYYKQKAEPERIPHLYLDYGALETETGLPKFPYIRDSRRSVGIGGFRLKKSNMDTPASSDIEQSKQYSVLDNSSPYGRGRHLLPDHSISNPQPLPPSKFATKFNDSIGLGNYFYADVHGSTNCPWPRYISNRSILPYHIPFRALTNQDFDNLLVAGITMAQTFQAEAATRMHPSDFMTGEAAGMAAVMMRKMNLTTSQLYHRVALLQKELEKVGVPLFWDKPRMKK